MTRRMQEEWMEAWMVVFLVRFGLPLREGIDVEWLRRIGAVAGSGVGTIV